MQHLTRERIRSLSLRYVEIPVARFLRVLGRTPNVVTLMGLATSMLAAVLVGLGDLLAGGFVFLLAGFMDLMDGSGNSLRGIAGLGLRPLG